MPAEIEVYTPLDTLGQRTASSPSGENGACSQSLISTLHISGGTAHYGLGSQGKIGRAHV